jgi:hypothetical protein
MCSLVLPIGIRLLDMSLLSIWIQADPLHPIARNFCLGKGLVELRASDEVAHLTMRRVAPLPPCITTSLALHYARVVVTLAGTGMLVK